MAAIHTLNYLVDLVGEKETTIRGLRALLVNLWHPGSCLRDGPNP